jgi:hypothetical protein
VDWAAGRVIGENLVDGYCHLAKVSVDYDAVSTINRAKLTPSAKSQCHAEQRVETNPSNRLQPTLRLGSKQWPVAEIR